MWTSTLGSESGIYTRTRLVRPLFFFSLYSMQAASQSPRPHCLFIVFEPLFHCFQGRMHGTSIKSQTPSAPSPSRRQPVPDSNPDGEEEVHQFDKILVSSAHIIKLLVQSTPAFLDGIAQLPNPSLYVVPTIRPSLDLYICFLCLKCGCTRTTKKSSSVRTQGDMVMLIYFHFHNSISIYLLRKKDNVYLIQILDFIDWTG